MDSIWGLWYRWRYLGIFCGYLLFGVCYFIGFICILCIFGWYNDRVIWLVVVFMEWLEVSFSLGWVFCVFLVVVKMLYCGIWVLFLEKDGWNCKSDWCLVCCWKIVENYCFVIIFVYFIFSFFNFLWLLDVDVWLIN